MKFFQERWRSSAVTGCSIAAVFSGIKFFVVLPDIFFVYFETPEFADPGLVTQDLLGRGYTPWTSTISGSPHGRIMPPGWIPREPGQIIFEDETTNKLAIRLIREAFAEATDFDRDIYGDYAVVASER